MANECVTEQEKWFFFQGKPLPKLYVEYLKYLKVVRGLATGTIHNRKKPVLLFLMENKRFSTPSGVKKLRPKHVHDYVTEKAMPLSRANETVLYQFNEFLNKHYPKLKIPYRITILDFLNSKPRLTVSGRRNYVIYIRQFCLFLNQRGIRCYLPDKTTLPKYVYEPRYCPLLEGDVKALMDGARDFHTNRPIVGEMYATVLGLLWCTGMRRKETVALNHKDVNLKTGVLFIKESKFRKSRFVPLEKSATKALKRYVELKKREGFSTNNESPFFINWQGGRVAGHSISTMLRRLVKRRGIQNEKGQYPRIHDLRHNFATQALKRFYTNTEKYPPASYVPTLSTYLGHTNMCYTQFYLHSDFNLMQVASSRFNAKMRVKI